VPVVRVDEPHLPCPTPVAVAHHADVAWHRLADQRAAESALIHPVEEIPDASLGAGEKIPYASDAREPSTRQLHPA